MQGRLSHMTGLLLTALGSFGLMYLLLGDRLFTLGSQMLERGGDSLKNIFTLAYLYKWDEGVWHTAMNYPYGEYAVYTDAQVGLVQILRLLRAIGIDSQEHILLIIQGLPILSFIIGAILVYQIARRYEVPTWWAVVISLCYIAFSPQITRHTAHFGLSYAFVIPGYWLYLIHSPSWQAWRTVLVGSIGLILSAFLHPYWILILMVFTLAYLLVYFVAKRQILWLVLLVSMGSLVTVVLINAVNDPVIDRPGYPYGLLAYHTQIRSLFSPHGYLHDLVTPLLSSRKPKGEGYAYVGPMLYIAILAFLLFLIFSKSRRKRLRKLGVPRELKVFFFASLVALSFAMGLHVVIGDGVILEMLPPLRQFRSLGRFAWIYCCIGSVFAGVVSYHLISELPWRWLRILVFAVALLLAGTEIYQWLEYRNQRIDKLAAKSNWLKSQRTAQEILEQSGRSAKRYQAVVTLPPAVEGSEKVGRGPGYHIKKYILPFVYQTGLPTPMSCMSRTSLSQTLKLLQLGGGRHVDKQWADDLPSDLPLLIAIEPADTVHFSDLLQSASLLGVQDHLALYEAPKALFDTTLPIDIESLEYPQNRTGYSLNSADDGTSEGLMGSPGYVLGKKSLSLVNLPVEIDSTSQAQASAWFRVEPEDRHIAFLKLSAYDSADNKLWGDWIRHSDHHRFEIHGEWYRLTTSRTISPKVKRLSLEVMGQGLQVDQALITVDNTQPIFRINEQYVQVGHSIFSLAE